MRWLGGAMLVGCGRGGIRGRGGKGGCGPQGPGPGGFFPRGGELERRGGRGASAGRASKGRGWV